MEKEKYPTITKGALQKSSCSSLASCTPMALQVSCKGISTPLQAADSGHSSLCVMVKEYGQEKVEALIQMYLIELNEYLNLKRPLTEKMIDAIAADIVEDYRYLNMADVWLVFSRARKGYYGELYESINTAKVEGWFRDYFNERCEAAEEASIAESESYKGDHRRTSDIAREKEHAVAAGAFHIKYDVP